MELSDQLLKLSKQYLLENQSRDIAAALESSLDSMAANGQAVSNESEVASQASVLLQGYGVLQKYLDDPEVEEIWINRPNEVFYSRSGSSLREVVNLPAEQLQTLVQRMLRSSNRRVDRLNPFADSATESGNRLHVVIPEVTAQHWAVNIRKFKSGYRSLPDLTQAGMLTEAQAEFLRQQMRLGKNLLISGPTQAGKTTLLGALLDELPVETRLVSCEETFEIKCSLIDWVALQTRQPNLEGQGEIPLRRLVKEALRMRPDRLVIGEVREAESFDLLIAMNSGLPGVCTIHANSARAALQKLSTLPLLAGPNITSEFITATLANSLDFVLHLGFERGKRVVKDICSVEQNSGSLLAKEVKL